jgi:uracil-DNA glycosylase
MIDINQETSFKNLSTNEFKNIVSNCHNCELAKTRTNVVFGHGPIPCKIMMIGEGPGEQEDLHGKPFIGRSGKLLTKILESAGINRETDTFITNTVKCRPPENRTPLSKEIKACRGLLIRQIQLVKPKILILLGAPALKTILEEKLAISKVRGQWYKAAVNYMNSPLYIMPIFHPSYLLRNASNKINSPKWLTSQDFNAIKHMLDLNN